MSEKRKISTRKIVQTILTIVLLCACVFVVLSASKWQGEKRVMGVHIEIENEDYCQFVSKEEIQARLGMEDEEVDRLIDRSGMPIQAAKHQEGFGNSWRPKAKD